MQQHCQHNIDSLLRAEEIRELNLRETDLLGPSMDDVYLLFQQVAPCGALSKGEHGEESGNDRIASVSA